MIIDDLHVPCRAVAPDEAHPPLIVDADAPLALAVAFQGFQPVVRRNAQRVNALGGVQHLELPDRHLCDIGEAGYPLALKQGPGLFGSEPLDHGLY